MCETVVNYGKRVVNYGKIVANFLRLLIVGLILGGILGGLEFVVIYYHKPIFPPAIGAALCLSALLAVAAGSAVVAKRKFRTRWLPFDSAFAVIFVVSGFVVFAILMFTDWPLPQFLISNTSLINTVLPLALLGILLLKRAIRR